MRLLSDFGDPTVHLGKFPSASQQRVAIIRASRVTHRAVKITKSIQPLRPGDFEVYCNENDATTLWIEFYRQLRLLGFKRLGFP